MNPLNSQQHYQNVTNAPPLIVIGSPLKQLAALIKRLSFRDMQGLADAVRDANDLTDITEEALLFAADALESPNV